ATILTGNANANTLNGGGGADTMNAGLGDDIYIVDNAGDVAFETSAAGGIDEGQTAVRVTLSSDIEHLTLTGANPINGTGNGLATILTGNDAANVLNGMGSGDVLQGVGGNDSLHGGTGRGRP